MAEDIYYVYFIGKIAISFVVFPTIRIRLDPLGNAIQMVRNIKLFKGI